MASLGDRLKKKKAGALGQRLLSRTIPDMSSAREDIPEIEDAAEQLYSIDQQAMQLASEAEKQDRARGLKIEERKIGSIPARIQDDQKSTGGMSTPYKLAEQSGANKEDLRALEKRQAQIESGKIDPNSNLWKDILSTSVEKLGTVLDTGGRVTRNAVMAATGDSKFEPGKAFMNNREAAGVDEAEYLKHLQEGKTASARALNTTFDVAATPVKGILALKNLAFGDDLQEAWRQADKSGRDFTTLALSDATNALSFGAGQGIKAAEKQGLRMATAAGLEAGAAKKFSEEFAKKSLEVGGKVSAGKELMDFAKGAGISEKAAAKVIGKSGELAGRTGLQVLGKDVTLPGVPEQLLARGKNAATSATGKGLEKIAPNAALPKLMQLSPAERAAVQQTIVKTKGKLGEFAEKAAGDYLENVKNSNFQRELLQDKEILKGEAVGAYNDISKGAHGKARKDLKDWAGSAEVTQLGPDKANKIAGIVDARTKIKESSKYGKTMGAVGKGMDTTIDWLRETALKARGGYHFQNIVGDTLLAASHDMASLRGANGARKILGNAADDAIVASNKFEKLTKGQVLKEMEDQGVLNLAEKGFDTGGMAPSLRDFERGLYQATDQKVPLHLTKMENVAKYPTLGLNKVGKKISDKWENFEKAAVYTELRNQGLSPQAAAQKMQEAIFNYRDPGSNPALLEAFKKANPLGGWLYRAAKAVPQGVAKSPMLSRVPMNVSRSMNREDMTNPYEVRQSAREKALPFTVSKTGRNAFNKLSGAVGLPQVPEGMGMAVMGRAPTEDVASNFRGEQLYESSPPWTRVYIDYTKGETPYGEKFLTAEDKVKYGLRTAGQLLAGPAIGLAMDVGTTLADVKNPLTGYDPQLDPYAKQKIIPKVLRNMTGLNLEFTNPNNPAQDLMYSDERGNLKARLERAKQLANRYKSSKENKKLLGQ